MGVTVIDYNQPQWLAEFNRRGERIAELEAERDRMREALAEAVEKYGKPGGPWNIPGESGSWIAKAREALEGAEG